MMETHELSHISETFSDNPIVPEGKTLIVSEFWDN